MRGGANVGDREHDDLLLKLMLVLVRDRRAMQGRIHSVRFMREYGTLPEDLGAITLGGMSDAEQADLAAAIGIGRTPEAAKCHLYLNDVGYRIEPLSVHPTVVTDRLTAAGLRAVCRKLGLPEEELEEGLRTCWARRQEDGGGLRFAATGSPFRENGSWRRVVSYLLFTGNEQGEDSLFAADGLLDYGNPTDTETWAILGKEEAVDALWPRLRIKADGGGDFDSACFRIWAPVSQDGP